MAGYEQRRLHCGMYRLKSAAGLLALAILVVTAGSHAARAQIVPPSSPLPLTELIRAEPAVLQDYGLLGPVKSLSVERFRVDPAADPPKEMLGWAIVLGSYEPAGFGSYRLHFDEGGRLLEREFVTVTDIIWQRFEYYYDEGRYLGFAEFNLTGDQESRRAGLDITWLDAHTAEWQWYGGITPSAPVVYRVDDSGRRLESFSTGPDGELVLERTYHYQGDWLIAIREHSDGTATSIQETRLTMGEVAGQPVVLSDEWWLGDRMHRLSEYAYYADGTMARLSRQFDGHESATDLGRAFTHETEFDLSGRKTRQTSLRGPAITRRETYTYDGDRLLRFEEWKIDSEGSVTVRTCLYSGHDDYGNWTDSRCTGYVPLAAAREGFPAEFSGILETREYSYHAR